MSAWGCLPRRWMSAWVVSAWRGMSARRGEGVCLGGVNPSMQWARHPPPTCVLRYRSRCQDDIFPRIELIPFIVLSSDNTNCKNDIQLFHQLFDELSVYRDYH